MTLDSPLEVGTCVDTASRTISGSSLTSMTVVLQERLLSLSLRGSGTIQGQDWPQAGVWAEVRLQPGKRERGRESHFLRRAGGGSQQEEMGGGAGETSSFVNGLAGNQGESLKGVPVLLLLFSLFCLLPFLFCPHSLLGHFTSVPSFSHLSFPPFSSTASAFLDHLWDSGDKPFVK